jgi:hypothetical protein
MGEVHILEVVRREPRPVEVKPGFSSRVLGWTKGIFTEVSSTAPSTPTVTPRPAMSKTAVSERATQLCIDVAIDTQATHSKEEIGQFFERLGTGIKAGLLSPPE